MAAALLSVGGYGDRITGTGSHYHHIQVDSRRDETDCRDGGEELLAFVLGASYRYWYWGNE